MTRYWLARFLLSPSIVSGTICFVLAVGATIAIAWSYIADNQLFYDFLFGAKGASTALVTAPDSMGAFQNVLLNSQFTFYILLAGAAVASGLLVYALLQSLNSTMHSATEIVRGLRKKDAVAKHAAQTIIVRLAVRTVSLVGWALYMAFFINILVPFCALLVNGGTADITDSAPSGWWLVLGGFALVLLGLHMNVIFARLVLLKPRLFSSNDIPLSE